MTSEIGTTCVQGGYHPGNGEPRQIPIYQNTTWKYDSSEFMGRLFDLEEEGYFYTRCLLYTSRCDGRAHSQPPLRACDHGDVQDFRGSGCAHAHRAGSESGQEPRASQGRGVLDYRSERARQDAPVGCPAFGSHRARHGIGGRGACPPHTRDVRYARLSSAGGACRVAQRRAGDYRARLRMDEAMQRRQVLIVDGYNVIRNNDRYAYLGIDLSLIPI